MFEKTKEISSKKAEEQQVFNILEKRLIAGGFTKEEIHIVRIETNLFSVGTEKNISFYCDEKGNISFNIGFIREQPFFKNFLFMEELHEIRNENGEYKLFRKVRDISKNKDEYMEIPLYSKEYFSAWENIMFYMDKFIVSVFKRADINNNYHSLSKKEIQNLYKYGTLRIRDLLSFLEHKQITQEIYDIYIGKLIEDLPSQIRDIRLYKIEDIVTLEEIQEYLKRKLITKEMFILGSKQIESRDKLLGDTKNKKENIKKDTSSKLRQQHN